jgi:CMP-N-acetylneuraminic acid synthetase
LSTDEPRIAEAGKAAGAEVLLRPDEIAQDNSTVTDMLDHHFATLQSEGRLPDYIVYLEPTSPFRTPDLIRQCVDHCLEDGVDSAATFKVENFHPSWLLKEDDAGALHKYAADVQYSQHNSEKDSIYALSGSVYVFSVQSYLTQRPKGIFFGNYRHVIEGEFSIDIDIPLELAIARAMLPRLDDPVFKDIGVV